jgi:uncharacterized protein YhjY with autotransporter beta-barrel domain
MVGTFPNAILTPAGPTVTVDETTGFPLDFNGLSSTDSDGTIDSCEFSLDSAAFLVSSTCTIQYTSLTPGDHTLALRVTDNHGLTDTTSLTIDVLSYPEAVAGPDQSLTDSDNNGSEDVSLDGSGSSDTGGSIVSYEWFEFDVQSFPAIATGVAPTLTLDVGTHNLTLRITDDDGMVTEDQVVITVLPAPNAPVADAGPDQQLTDSDNNASEEVVLDGTGSTDADGTITTYQWLENGMEIASGVSATISLPVGIHTLTLRVTDNDDLIGEDQVTITIVADSGTSANAPIANAGTDQSLVDSDGDGSASVTLDGTASSDTDGAIVSYLWLEGDTEIATGANPTAVLSVGVHALTLVVTDDAGLTAQDQVTITIQGEESQLQILSGSNLSGSSGDTLGPFIVKLVDKDDNIYIDGLIQIGSNRYETKRRINTAGAADQFGLGDTDGTEYAFNLSAGYDYRRDAWTLTPYGRLSYTRARIDGYTETASSPTAAGVGSVLHIEDQDLKSLVLVLGGDFSYTVSTPKAVLMPQLRFEWEHEFEDDSRFINARFVNDPTRSAFAIETDEADSDYLNLGIGLSAIFSQGRSGYIFYETRLGQDGVTLHTINAGLRIEF